MACRNLALCCSPAAPQAGESRTSIGSGLLQLGLKPKEGVGLYSVNCKGGWGDGWPAARAGVGSACALLQRRPLAIPWRTLTPASPSPTHTKMRMPHPTLSTLTRAHTAHECTHMHAEWVLVDCALHAYSLVSVPLYDTLGPDAVEYICSHAELAAVACSAAVAPTMVAALPKCPTVRVLVGGRRQKGRLPRKGHKQKRKQGRGC